MRGLLVLAILVAVVPFVATACTTCGSWARVSPHQAGQCRSEQEQQAKGQETLT